MRSRDAPYALTLLGRLTSFFAILATHREGKGSQAPFGDLVAALETVAVGVFVEPSQCHVDLVQRFRFHLDQRELDLFLDVDLGALALVEHLALLGDVGPRVANLALNFVHQLAAAVLEHLPQFVIPASVRRCHGLRRRRHDACGSF